MNKFDYFHIPHLTAYLDAVRQSKVRAGLKSIISWCDLKEILEESNLKKLDRLEGNGYETQISEG